MRKFMLIMLGLFSTLVINAEVVMKLGVSRSVFIQYEPVIVNLALRNTSGQVLVFGSEVEFKGYITIDVRDSKGNPIEGSGAKVDMKGLILRPGTDHHIRLDLSKRVKLEQSGTYKVRLYISHPLLQNEFASNTCTFDVSKGRVFWEKKFGVPQMDANKAGEVLPTRTYYIRALLDKSEIYLFLFIEDEKNIYAIKRLGIQLGNQRAKCEVDSLNRLHVFLPLSPKVFHYQVFDWNGKREINKFYQTAQTIPVLYRNRQTGDVTVVGGEAAQLGVDYAGEKLLPGK